MMSVYLNADNKQLKPQNELQTCVDMQKHVRTCLSQPCYCIV